MRTSNLAKREERNNLLKHSCFQPLLTLCTGVWVKYTFQHITSYRQSILTRQLFRAPKPCTTAQHQGLAELHIFPPKRIPYKNPKWTLIGTGKSHTWQNYYLQKCFMSANSTNLHFCLICSKLHHKVCSKNHVKYCHSTMIKTLYHLSLEEMTQWLQSVVISYTDTLLQTRISHIFSKYWQTDETSLL